MIDRMVNLITLLVLFLTFVVLLASARDAWNKTEPWEQSWVAIEGAEQPYSSDRLVNAIRNAKSQNAYADASRLTEILKEMYEPTGEVSTRFNRSEIKEIALFVLGTLLLLFVPASINYVRKGRFKIWNTTMPDK